MTTAKRRERKNAYWRENKPTVMAARSLESMKREREEAAREVRQRLSQRDADYAASPCAAPVTVEERGGIRIETRGQRCIGWRSSGHVSHG